MARTAKSDKVRGSLWHVSRKARKRLGIDEKDRPCLIVQNDLFEPYGSRTVCTLTSASRKDEATGKFTEAKEPRDTQVPVIPDDLNELREFSLISCDQLYTIKKGEFLKPRGKVSREVMFAVDVALKLALDLK